MFRMGTVVYFTLINGTNAVGKYNCNECDLCSKRETIKMKNNNILAQ